LLAIDNLLRFVDGSRSSTEYDVGEAAMRSLFWVMFLAACDDDIFPVGEGGDTYTPDWAGTQLLIEDHCVSCHATTEPVLPDALIPDIQNEVGDWVVPGDPEASVLWRVMSGNLQDGDAGVMPLGTGPLPASATDPVAEWITVCDPATFPDGN